jgi:hypothetical protein
MSDNQSRTNDNSSGGESTTPPEPEETCHERSPGCDAENVAQSVGCHPETIHPDQKESQTSDNARLQEEFDATLEATKRAVGKMIVHLRYQCETYEKRLVRLKMHKLEMLLAETRRVLSFSLVHDAPIAAKDKSYIRKIIEEISAERHGGKEQ